MVNSKRVVLALAAAVALHQCCAHENGGVAVTVVDQKIQNVAERIQKAQIKGGVEKEQDAKGPEGVDLLERVLYGLPQPDPDLPPQGAKERMSPEEYEAALRAVWDKRQKEIKEVTDQIENVGSAIVNDTNVLKEALLEEAPAKLIDALENLEWVVQDIDQATHFIGIGGLEACYRLLDHAASDVRKLAAHVVGNSVKGQPELQEKAVEGGMMNTLVLKLEGFLETEENVHNGEVAKMWYGLSSLVRGHAQLQNSVVEAGLPTLLLAYVKTYSNNMEGFGERVLVKVLALLYDSYTAFDSTCVAAYKVNQTEQLLCDSLEGLRARFENDTIVLEHLTAALKALGCV
mmetsp:Transcript_18765/g.30650  ORF Transcript_18765/g.30650 Transcript_18765/m.30650 type:complete len:346 (+) Transcript_18765:158-1195(+)|eukprot:CAMPEP_0203769022 /NCGR_PEP_ID=MMETSP0099_2-20121227/1943_1 /ASSEMBLY_ACC=CAM_ASM_000209 /TAXON_ID=96639 /ORGANISM=" , Strain NY0313808BC1" /LENGTH=345 /DNA_ID=CAMNT_0050665839 /DNA_START=115 /DNA_END=1152 /DNA_ORIENTATION=+